MSKFIYDIDLNQNQLQNAVIQSLSTAPSNPKEGQIYYDTTDKNIYRFDGTSWVTYQSELETTATSTLSIDSTPTNNSSNLVTSGGVYTALQNVDSLPDQTGQSGKYLTTNGTDASWANVPSYSFSNGLTESSGTVYNTGILNVEASPAAASNGTVAVTTGTSAGGTSTSYVAVKGLGSAAYTDSSAYLPSTTTIPTAYTSSPVMDGTASSGSSSAYAKGDHVHPTDTTRQEKITASGILKGEGDGVVTAAVAGTDYQAPLPSQSGQSGKFLTTNGSALSWDSVDALPSQTGQAGKYLTTNGSAAMWANVNGTFVVNVTENGGTYTADKTYQEIADAVESNKSVIVIYGTLYFCVYEYVPVSGSPGDYYDGTVYCICSYEGGYFALSVSGGGTESEDSWWYRDSSDNVFMHKGVDYVTAGQKANTTLGTKATSEGYDTTASGTYAHAEGQTTKASGNGGSHSEGSSTTASGVSAHAEGGHTTASGNYSHAEGYSSSSSGPYSHAEGYSTTSSGNYSHAEGQATTANRKSQSVSGEYNILDTGGSGIGDRGTYVEIVGNGTANDARSNARTLDWSGNEVLAGKLTVGVGPTNNMDVATKQYVDTAIGTAIAASY